MYTQKVWPMVLHCSVGYRQACVHIYEHVYIHILHIHVCIHIRVPCDVLSQCGPKADMRRYISTHVYTCTYIHMYVYTYICPVMLYAVWADKSRYIRAYVCLCIYTSVNSILAALTRGYTRITDKIRVSLSRFHPPPLCFSLPRWLALAHALLHARCLSSILAALAHMCP